MSAQVDFFRDVADRLEALEERPYGPEPSGNTRSIARRGLVELCKGDEERANSVWKLIEYQLGYMPHAACVALIRASSGNIVPQVEAPEPT